MTIDSGTGTPEPWPEHRRQAAVQDQAQVNFILLPADAPEPEPGEQHRLPPLQCLCGRFAKFISYRANTMPHGEAVTTVRCAACGEVEIR